MIATRYLNHKAFRTAFYTVAIVESLRQNLPGSRFLTGPRNFHSHKLDCRRRFDFRPNFHSHSPASHLGQSSTKQVESAPSTGNFESENREARVSIMDQTFPPASLGGIPREIRDMITGYVVKEEKVIYHKVRIAENETVSFNSFTARG